MSGLRVIAGTARGRKLRSVPGDQTRPITDRAKESLFNILAGDIRGSSFLDLFAGTGSVGIEALSRGAGFACFNDQQRQAVETIRSNLAATDLRARAVVLRQDAFRLLQQQPDRVYDYVFIAPPQYKDLWARALADLDKNPAWLSPDAWVIVQIHPVEEQEIQLDNLKLFDKRQYGSVLFLFYARR
jgi:16S rRNA (guanine(966)-N(2))-methyltransferase RsmD